MRMSICSFLLTGICLLSLFSSHGEAQDSPAGYPPNRAENAAQSRLAAKQAAKIDAIKNLTELIHGTEINSKTRIKDIIAESDAVRARLAIAIKGARDMDYFEAPDGIAEVTVEVPVAQIEDILGRKINYDEQVFTAVGYGSPSGEDPYREAAPPAAPAASAAPEAAPPAALQAAQAAAPPALPPASNVIWARGNGIEPADPSMSPAERSLLAKRAAKVDALRNLLEQVYGVTINSSTTVREAAGRSDNLRVRVNSFIQGARVVAERPLGDGTYEMEVEIDAAPLVKILDER